MSEDHLMNGLLIIVFSGIVIFIYIQSVKNFFPLSAFKSFSSLNEIKQYYTSSLLIIKKNAWLLFLPLFLTLSNYLFKIPFFLYQRPDLSSMPDDFIARLHGISVADIIKSFFKTPNVLDYGFHGAITGNFIFLVFFLICCVTFKAESKRLKRHASEKNMDNVAYFEKILKYCLILLIIIAALAAAIFLTGEQANNFLFYILYSPSMILIGVMSLSVFSLIEGVILFAVNGAISGEQHQNFTTLLNQSLSILKTLFLLNIIIVTIGYLPSVVRFPITVSSFLGAWSGRSSMIPLLLHLASFFTYCNSLLMVFIFCAPFLLVVHHATVKDVFTLLFNIIRNNFLKYLIFVGTGIIILFLPTLFHMVLNTYLHPLKLEYIIVEMFFTAVKISLAVVFYIAMFDFVIDINFNNIINKDIT